MLRGTAVFALVWVVARACVQSITIDEADTYLCWVGRPSPSHWSAAANNHLLNSLLMRLFTDVFGLSHLSLRLPALIGAAIYIAMAYALCRRFAPDARLAWPLLVCLVYNPFILDHLVAARGYALALAFLMVSLAVVSGKQLDVRECGVCSVCAALSFAANFAFAFVNAALIGAVFLVACARVRKLRERLRLLAACIAPGLVVSLFLSAPAVLNMSEEQLQYGSHSLREMLRTVAQASLFELNPQIVNPVLLQWIGFATPFLVPAVLLLAAWQLRRRQPAFAYVLLGVLAAAISLHLGALKFRHLLLPKDRTAIWIVPLLTLAVGIVAANRRALNIMLYAMSIYFLLCLRIYYFKEWAWDADMKEIYPVLAHYNHVYGVKDVAANWEYGSALNVYRLMSGRETLPEIPSPVEIQPGHAVYVLNYPFDEGFLRKEGLRVVYHGTTTDAVVAVRPEVACLAQAAQPR